MKSLPKKTREFMRELYPYVKVRKNEVIVEEPFVENPRRMVIPSDLYPLWNRRSLKMFTYADTEQLEEHHTVIAKAFNECRFKIGHCYQNVAEMQEVFHRHKIYDISPYVGWVLFGGTPIHHAWLVYKDKHVLDPGISLVNTLAHIEFQKQNLLDQPEKRRKIITELYAEHADKPNSEFYTFGLVAPFALYIGTVTTPMQGAKMYGELIEKYPNHPSYQKDGMNAHGASKLQEMIVKRLEEK